MKETYQLDKEVKVAVEPESEDSLLDKLDEPSFKNEKPREYLKDVDYA